MSESCVFVFLTTTNNDQKWNKKVTEAGTEL